MDQNHIDAVKNIVENIVKKKHISFYIVMLANKQPHSLLSISISKATDVLIKKCHTYHLNLDQSSYDQHPFFFLLSNGWYDYFYVDGTTWRDETTEK